jgi:hypothetical protein
MGTCHECRGVTPWGCLMVIRLMRAGIPATCEQHSESRTTCNFTTETWQDTVSSVWRVIFVRGTDLNEWVAKWEAIHPLAARKADRFYDETSEQ